MNICMFLSESEFEEDSFDSDVLMSMTETDDPSYVLDLRSMQESQLVVIQTAALLVTLWIFYGFPMDTQLSTSALVICLNFIYQSLSLSLSLSLYDLNT